MRRVLLSLLALGALRLGAAPAAIELPPFPLPALAADGGAPADVGPIRLLRQLQRAGLHGTEDFETADNDYALFRHDSLGVLASWLDAVCAATHYDLRHARAVRYDGTVFARLLQVATSLAALKHGPPGLAMPVGVAICRRTAAWGALPGDGATDAYVVLATDAGMLIYDPPSRQLVPLADFPNKRSIQQIRF